MSHLHWSNPWLRLTVVLIIAGLCYASWPLGYWLNPSGARGLASNLEAMHQPYNWLFIALDIISGLLIVGAVWWMLRLVRRTEHRNQVLLEVAVIGLGAFGLLTALDAILPLNCVETVQHCLPPLEDPYFVIHGIVSIGSVAGLTLSIVAIWWLIVRDHRARKVSRHIVDLLLIIWIGFGAGTAILVARDRSSTPTQHAFILFCSLWVIIIPYYIRHMLHTRRSSANITSAKTKVRTKQRKQRNAN